MACRPPGRISNQGQVQEILIAVTVLHEMVVVVADQVRLDDLDELLEVLAIGQYRLVVVPTPAKFWG